MRSTRNSNESRSANLLVASQPLDTLCDSWRDVLIGISTDGEKKMTGQAFGAGTSFQQVCRPGFNRISCGAHQLDLGLQDAYSNFGNDTFFVNFTAAIGYLRRQQNLVKNMRSQAPKVEDTRWESRSHVSAWFKLYRIEFSII